MLNFLMTCKIVIYSWGTHFHRFYSFN